MYTVRKLDDGAYEIRNSFNEVISENVNDDHFCEFLTWLSMQADQQAVGYRQVLSPQTYYFCNGELLIEHLKNYGAMIHVSPVDGAGPRSVSFANPTLIGTEKLFNLPRAFLREDDPDFIWYGWGGDEKSGFEGRDSKTFVTRDLLEQINHSLRDDKHEFRRLSSWSITRSFVYIDVSDFSKARSGHQALIINAIIGLVNNDDLWRSSPIRKINRSCEAMLCIGDGYIFVFNSAVAAAYFAAFLAHLIECMISKKRVVEFHFRIGVHVGRVFCFWDIGRRGWNYVGDGINGGNRVLSAIGKEADDIVFISAQVREKLIGNGSSPSPEILMNLQNRGRKADKHGNPWRVYELNHSALTANVMPVDLMRE